MANSEENWKKIIRASASEKSQTNVQYFDAKLTNVRSDYLRGDVELITGQTINNMLNKTGEKIYAGQNVKIGYTSVPSKGWIALAYGEADPLGGGGEPSTGITIDNAAIITPIQASRFITEEEVIYVDEEELVKIVYGKIPNWFYVNGYPCRFRATTAATPLSDAEVSAIAANDITLLPSVYEIRTSATTKTKYHSDMYAYSLQSKSEGGTTNWYMRYTIDVMSTAYTLVDGAWVEGSTTRPYSQGSVYVDLLVTFGSGGQVQMSAPLYEVGFYAFTTSYGATEIGIINLVPVAILSDSTTGAKTAMRFTRSGSAISPATIYHAQYKSNAEKIFALGMTHTTEVIPDE